jgi:type IV fimbrial biogenesis protein FimT
MVSRWFHRLNARGFSFIELSVVMAVIGVAMAISVPFFLTYWQSSTLKAGAEELVTALNGARQLALNRNQSVCVTNNTTTVAYHLGTCGAAAWTGLGTESDGSIRLANGVRVSAATANATFNYLGAAGTGATYTVLHAPSSRALCVVVAPSGRITVAPPATQPTCP